MATPPSSDATPSRPMAAVPTMPSSGVVRLASIAGPAMAKTRALVTGKRGGGEDLNNSLSSAALHQPGCAQQPRDQPDRDDDGGAQQEVAPQPAYRIEAHLPYPLEQRAQALDDVPGVEPQYLQDHADQDRQQHEAENHRQRRAAEETADRVVAAARTLGPSVGRRPFGRHGHD